MSFSTATSINIIPIPRELETREHSFTLTPDVVIHVDQETITLGKYLSGLIAGHTGWELAVIDAATEAESTIRLELDATEKHNPEGYTLLIENELIIISASQPAGLFYGCQTLRQLLPVIPADRQKITDSGTWVIPGLKISDAPRFQWRGMMLDVSRHFFPVEFIKELIDYLALHKINVFHWHLMDDQGWRLEIKQYPKLTEIGAWRVDRNKYLWSMRPPQEPGEEATYGGFYTQDEIREVVAYAAERHITVVPEIEMPAHITCALAAYPELSCTGGPFTVPPGSIWPIKDIYCAGREETFEFLENVLTEVMDLFPSEYIHIGGDEAHKGRWEVCDSCQARIKAEGLADESELQSYFIKRIEKFLNTNGRQLIGWDEILEGGLAPEATVMSWRGTKGGIAAAKSGHQAVMSPVSHCYLNCYQGNLDLEPKAQSGYLPITKVYSFNPVPKQLNADEGQLILGAQANLWAEFVPNPKHAEYMLFPRLSALSEVMWSPEEKRDWDDFSRRLYEFFPIYEFMDMNYSTSAMQVRMETKKTWFGNKQKITMNTEMPGLSIHYTTDGSSPDQNSPVYSKPFKVATSTDLQAVSIRAGKIVSPVTSLNFRKHIGLGKSVKLGKRWHWRYTGGGNNALSDGILANDNYRNSHWQGFRVDDLEATINLGRTRPVNSISVNFLQDIHMGLFMPAAVEFAVSSDGTNFQVIETLETGIPQDQQGAIIKTVITEMNGNKARYIRVRAKNVGHCPEWHQGAGKDAYLFADEIVVE